MNGQMVVCAIINTIDQVYSVIRKVTLRARRGMGITQGVLAGAGLILTLYMVLQIGLSIGDRFTTSDALSINETENADGYEAQTNLNTDFYSNVEFVMFLGFVVISALALYVVRSLGIFG
jgi:hypothetical protein